jgi:hypothetical protein
MNKAQPFSDKAQHIGIVLRQTFSGSTLKSLLEKETGVNFDACLDEKRLINFDVLCDMGLKVLGKEKFEVLKNKSIKKQFADNFLWRFLKRTFDLDVVIPGITGHWSLEALKGNLIVNTGHKAFADQIGGTTTAPFTAMAYGTGATAAAGADTALQTEVARGAATVTNTTTSTTGDTEQWVKTFTAPGTQAITEEGLLNNNTSGGILLARQVFSAINMVLNDTVQFTHKIQS